MKNILKIYNIMFILLIIMILKIWYSFFLLEKNYNDIAVNVKKGDTIFSIYDKLNLDYSFIDKIYFKIDTKISKIFVGTYRFNGKYTKYKILKKIKDVEIQELKLTIPEGFTKKQVYERINSLGLGTEREIEEVLKEIEFPYLHENNNFEGYFYPETYIFSENTTTKQVIETILNEFLKHFPLEKNKDKNIFYNQLKLASIVEAEVNNVIDKPKVAGVFIKRLEKGMKLESDATLKYELGRQAKKIDLKTNDSKYNSYKFKGLPPTPIGNPSYETVEAVKNPLITENLFFFMYNGKTYYSKTHEEHLKKRKESGQLK